jgi:hypothetical protein
LAVLDSLPSSMELLNRLPLEVVAQALDLLAEIKTQVVQVVVGLQFK